MEYTYHLNARGMSGRIIKYRVLDQDEVDAEEENGATAAGENADGRKLRKFQLKYLLAAMVVAYTAPNQPANRLPIPERLKARAGEQTHADDLGVPDPVALKNAVWIPAGNLLVTWKTIFNTKDTEQLKYLFTEHHEISNFELAMMQGKSQPVATGA